MSTATKQTYEVINEGNYNYPPLVTYITTSLNREKFIGDLLHVASKQTRRDFEHLFVDGYSDDSTVDMIRQYAKDNPDIRVILVKSPPKGISNAFNVGLKYANGKYINFLNSDDFFVNETSVERVSKILEKYPKIEFLQGNSEYTIGGYNKAVGYNVYRLRHIFHFLLTIYNPVDHQNNFVSREVYLKFGGFDEKLEAFMDPDFYKNILNEVDMFFVRDVYINHRWHNGSTVVSGMKHLFGYYKYAENKYGIKPLLSAPELKRKYGYRIKTLEDYPKEDKK